MSDIITIPKDCANNPEKLEQYLNEQKNKLVAEAKQKKEEADKIDNIYQIVNKEYGWSLKNNNELVKILTVKTQKETVKSSKKRLTPEEKSKIEQLLKSGDKKATDIAQEFGVSTATVNNIKSIAGLTKKRE